MRRILVPALQLLAAIAFGGLLIAFAASKADMRILAVVWWTAWPFGLLGYFTKDLWRSKAYWAIFCCALVLHFLLIAKLYSAGLHIGAIQFIPMYLLEIAVLGYILLTVGDRGPHSS